MSANSWANFGQQCQSCKKNVYPYEQTPLNKPDGGSKIDTTKEHLQELCGKCKELGLNCRELPSGAQSDSGDSSGTEEDHDVEYLADYFDEFNI
jgi:hypothetical protein